MQVVTSMYLQTSTARWVSWPGTVPGWPEICWICRMRSSLILVHLPSGPLDLDEEAFEFRRVGVRIDCGGRQLIGRIERGLARVLRDAAIAPMDRDADLISLLAVNQHRLDAFGNHRLRHIDAARARDLDLFTTRQPHLVCKLRRHFDERFGHKLDVH